MAFFFLVIFSHWEILFLEKHEKGFNSGKERHLLWWLCFQGKTQEWIYWLNNNRIVCGLYTLNVHKFSWCQICWSSWWWAWDWPWEANSGFLKEQQAPFTSEPFFHTWTDFFEWLLIIGPLLQSWCFFTKVELLKSFISKLAVKETHL